MTLAAKIRRAPLRIPTGAFILNSGLGKFNADDEAAKRFHSMASGAYPFLEKIPARPFTKALSVTEIAIGGAVLAPIVPAGLAGLAVIGFSAGLLGMYWRTPGMHLEDSVRPTRQGVPIAKDSWLLGIGTALVIDAALTESPITGEHARAHASASIKAEAKAARKSAKRAAKRAKSQAEALIPS